MTTDERPKTIEDMSPDELRAECHRSARDAHDSQMRLAGYIHNEARREREIRAAARRVALEDTIARQDFYLWSEVSRRLTQLDGVLYRIEQLGERASAKQVEALKDAANDARYMLSIHKDKPDTKLADMWETEARRLRSFIAEQGRTLHRQFSPGRTGYCNCQGCDLIRGMDMGVEDAA